MATRIALLGILLIGGTVIDSAWLSRLRLPALPDLMLLVVMVAGVRGGLVNGVLLGVSAGYLRDLVTGSPLGVFTMGYLLVGVAAGSMTSVVDLDQPLAPVVAAVSATALLHLSVSAIVTATGVASVQWPTLLEGLVVAATINALLARQVDRLVNWVDRISYRRFPEKAIGYRLWR
ncbi:MAG TPA: rod shape-determining protein MreD [bacterium]|nr:rod shape-determining protein MreD [bacterium]